MPHCTRTMVTLRGSGSSLDQLASASRCENTGPAELVASTRKKASIAGHRLPLTGRDTGPLNPQCALHLRRCGFNVSPFSGLCGLQKQLGCKVPMRSPLPPRPQQTDKARFAAAMYLPRGLGSASEAHGPARSIRAGPFLSQWQQTRGCMMEGQKNEPCRRLTQRAVGRQA
jgi:hypothetical protein